MQTTRWLATAIAAGWMGVAGAQGAGGGAGAGKDTSSSAGTRTPQGSDMQVGTGTGPRDPGTQAEESKKLEQGVTTAEQTGTAAAATATGTAEMAPTLAKLHAGHEAEIQAGSWMREHGTNSKVKEFAKRMVDDHGKLDKDTTQFAQKHDVELASAPEYTEAKAKHEAAFEQLKTAEGAQLDRQYMQMMVQDHQKDVSEVKTAAQQAKHGKNKEYTKLLEGTEKKMESHLKDARKISHDLASRQARQPTAQ